MGIGKRLKEAREAAKLTQEELGRLVGVTGSAITNYEKEVSHPKEVVMYALIDALQVEPNFLFQDCVKIKNRTKQVKKNDLDPYEIEHIKKYRTLDEYGVKAVNSVLDVEFERCHPVIKMITRPYYNTPVSAGLGNPLGEEYEEEIEIPDTPLNRQTSFIVSVSGDSMKPDFNSGDKVLVKSQEQVELGEIGIFVLNGESYIKKQEKNELISLNPKYPPIKLGEFDNIVCCGKVIGKLDPKWVR